MKTSKIISKMLRLAFFFVLTACAASAQPQKRSIDLDSSASGSPVVSIIKVTRLAVAGEVSGVAIRVEWVAQAPQITELLGFDVFVEVEYANGNKNSGSGQVGGGARQVIVSVPNRSGAEPRKFTARVITDFKFIDAEFVNRTEDFILEKTTGLQSTSQGARPTREVAITRVRAKLDECSAKNDCFIIDWSAGPTPSVTFMRFNIQADITYVTAAGDVQRSASGNFSGNARSAQFEVNDVTGATINRIVVKTKIKVIATIQKKSLAELKGSF